MASSFWTMHQARVPDEHVMELARAKLSGNTLDKSPQASLDSQMAVLDVRLCFDYETHNGVVSGPEARLVTSHMRLVYAVPDHRRFLRSGYSSEPILAEVCL